MADSAFQNHASRRHPCPYEVTLVLPTRTAPRSRNDRGAAFSLYLSRFEYRDLVVQHNAILDTRYVPYLTNMGR